MFEPSIELRKRFCKDNNISMQLFVEPYFSERLSLFGKKEKYDDFVKMIENDFNGNEEEYFAYYNKTKDSIIDYIKSSPAFVHLNSCDMNQFAVKTEYPQRDVYKESFIGRTFISIDIAKANFSSLILYAKTCKERFFAEDEDFCFNYDKFMEQFTVIPHIKDSKYIRQVVFGNCNPKRQVTYEKYVSNTILNMLFELEGMKKEYVVSLAHDEIILCADDMEMELLNRIKEKVDFLNSNYIPLHFEYFTLGRMWGTTAYIKKIYDTFDKDGNFEYVVKAANGYDLPLIYRKLNNEEIQENDLVFVQEGRLSKFLDVPKMEITFS